MLKKDFHPTPRGRVNMNDDALLKCLRNTFGHDDFRPIQKDVIQRILKGEDSVAVLPTGGGKSLVYQLPAALLRGVALVVSPLIALMQDQVRHLREKGISAAALVSTNSAAENREIMAGLEEAVPRYRVLFVTPERLAPRRRRPGGGRGGGGGDAGAAAAGGAAGAEEEAGAFDTLLQTLYDCRMISLLAVDEAHCISSWGHDFRPAYRALRRARRRLRGVPAVALTATATAQVKSDIIEQLEMEKAEVFVASFNRPNIHYEIVYKDLVNDAMEELLARVQLFGDRSCGIIYCQKRETCEYLANALLFKGVSATAYHAGLPKQQREAAQEAWTRGEAAVVCATVAFGMGVDKAGVRFVAHWDMPKTMEGLYQETGRAGRNGERADALIFYSRQDFGRFKFIISKTAQVLGLNSEAASIISEYSSTLPKRRHISKEQAKKKKSSEARAAQMLGALTKVKQFCEAPRCRRVGILEFFGERIPKVLGGKEQLCKETCDFCKNPIFVQQKLDKLNMSEQFKGGISLKSLKAEMNDDYQWVTVDDAHSSEGEYDKEKEDLKEAASVLEAPMCLEEIRPCTNEVDMWNRLEELEELEGLGGNNTKKKKPLSKKRARFADDAALVYHETSNLGKRHKHNKSNVDIEGLKSVLKKEKPVEQTKQGSGKGTKSGSINDPLVELFVLGITIEAKNEGATESAGLKLTVDRRRRLVKQLYVLLSAANAAVPAEGAAEGAGEGEGEGGQSHGHGPATLLRVARRMEHRAFAAAAGRREYKDMMTKNLQQATKKLKVKAQTESPSLVPKEKAVETCQVNATTDGSKIKSGEGSQEDFSSGSNTTGGSLASAVESAQSPSGRECENEKSLNHEQQRYYEVYAIDEERTQMKGLGLTIEKRKRHIERLIGILKDHNGQNHDRFLILEKAKQMEYDCFLQSSKTSIYKIMMAGKIREAKRVFLLATTSEKESSTS